MRKICVVTGYRSDYTKLKSVIGEIEKSKKLECQLVVFGSHLLEDYGNTVQDIRDDGFKINCCIKTNVEGTDTVSMTKSIGLGAIELATVFNLLQPDIVLIAGDRYEIMSAAIAAAIGNFPLAHIQGGEVTGTIDESIRHAVTKLAHIHFPATEESRQRIIKMGELPELVWNVGCTALDHIKYVAKECPRKIGNEIILMFHPVTSEWEKSYEYMTNILRAVEKNSGKHQCSLIYPTSYSGSSDMVKAIRDHEKLYGQNSLITKKYKNISFDKYIKSLANARCLIGNSSSGIREAQIFDVPVINIGTRQTGRERGLNVLDTGYSEEEILSGIEKALQLGRIESENIYGGGDASKKIVHILENLELDGILQKRINY